MPEDIDSDDEHDLSGFEEILNLNFDSDDESQYDAESNAPQLHHNNSGSSLVGEVH